MKKTKKNTIIKQNYKFYKINYSGLKKKSYKNKTKTRNKYFVPKKNYYNNEDFGLKRDYIFDKKDNYIRRLYFKKLKFRKKKRVKDEKYFKWLDQQKKLAAINKSSFIFFFNYLIQNKRHYYDKMYFNGSILNKSRISYFANGYFSTSKVDFVNFRQYRSISRKKAKKIMLRSKYKVLNEMKSIAYEKIKKSLFKLNDFFIKKLFLILVKKGYKYKIYRIYLNWINFIKFSVNKNNLNKNLYIYQVINNILPKLNLKNIYKRRKIYALPNLIKNNHKQKKKMSILASSWFKKSFIKRKEKTFILKFMSELFDIRLNKGSSVALKKEYYKTFYNNKKYIKFMKSKKYRKGGF